MEIGKFGEKMGKTDFEKYSRHVSGAGGTQALLHAKNKYLWPRGKALEKKAYEIFLIFAFFLTF